MTLTKAFKTCRALADVLVGDDGCGQVGKHMWTDTWSEKVLRYLEGGGQGGGGVDF